MNEYVEQRSIDEIDLLPAASGIYAIVNTERSGARYVGRAKNIKLRIKTHIHDLELGRERTNTDMLLQRAWSAYGRTAFVVQVLELVDDNEVLTVAYVRNDNLALAEHHYINARGEYNKDTKIVRVDQLGLVELKAWRDPLDAQTLERLANATPYSYKVGSRVRFDYAVLVAGFNERHTKLIARSISDDLAKLGNLSSERLSKERLAQSLADGIPDYRHATIGSVARS